MRSPDFSEIEVTIPHPFGELTVPLEEWIRVGPGPRELLQPVAARCKRTGRDLGLSAIPLRYRNNCLSRFLIRLGYLEDPWRSA
jgi:hypothetical protein